MFTDNECRLEAKFHYSVCYLVADRFEADSKLVANLQQAESWPII